MDFGEKYEVVLTANGEQMQTKGVGKVLIEVFNKTKDRKLGYSRKMYCMYRSTSLT